MTIPIRGVRVALCAALGWIALVTAALVFAPLATAQTAPSQTPPQGLVVQADFVQGTANVSQEDIPVKACVQTSRFPRNADIVFRARVWDPQTGLPMDDQNLYAISVSLTDGSTMAMKYGVHGGSDMFWTAAWLVPKDYPPGTLNYSIVATSKDLRTGQFQPFNVMPSLLTITSDVAPDVAAQ
jgi:hypothetical protein